MNITNVRPTGKMQMARTAAFTTLTSTPARWDTWCTVSSCLHHFITDKKTDKKLSHKNNFFFPIADNREHLWPLDS